MAQTRNESNSNSTTERLAGMAHETVDRAAGIAGNAEQDVREAAARTARRARQMQDQAAEAADEGARRVRSYVEDNPLLAAGIAFAAGVLLSSLLRR